MTFIFSEELLIISPFPDQAKVIGSRNTVANQIYKGVACVTGEQCDNIILAQMDEVSVG